MRGDGRGFVAIKYYWRTPQVDIQIVPPLFLSILMKERFMSKERETVTWEELAWSNQIEQEALVRILVSKGIITQEDLLNEVRQVQSTYAAKKL